MGAGSGSGISTSSSEELDEDADEDEELDEVVFELDEVGVELLAWLDFSDELEPLAGPQAASKIIEAAKAQNVFFFIYSSLFCDGGRPELFFSLLVVFTSLIP